jgi:alpha/beta superfamily hydrolase
MLANETECLLRDGLVYTTHYQGEGDTCVVIVPPLFEEVARTQKVLVTLARDLAAAGLSVARFDFRGTGLSVGRFRDFLLTEAQADLAAVLDFCRAKGAKRFAFLGFRFGAYLVSSLLAEPWAVRAVLWEPIFDLTAYFREMLRIEVANQLVIFGEVRYTSDTLVALLQGGTDVLIDGFPTTPALHAQFTQARRLDLAYLAQFQDKVTLAYWDGKAAARAAEAAGLRASLLRTVKFSWKNVRSLEARSEELFAFTAQNLTIATAAPQTI